jgi:hypothetical protein
VRSDGLPFADDITKAFGAGSPYYPLTLDQNAAVGPANVWTGTNADGSVGLNCTNWTDNASAGGGIVGNSLDGGTGWTDATQAGCSVSAALYCFGTARNGALTFSAPANARRAFLTSDILDGTGDSDMLCQMEAVGNVVAGRFRAWRNHPASSGLVVFDQTAGPWARLDNVLLAPIAPQALLDSTSSQLLAPLHMQANGVHVDPSIIAWIGNALNNCADWTSTGVMGAYSPATRYRSGIASMTCGANARAYCFEE